MNQLSCEKLSTIYGGRKKKYRGPNWRCIADLGIGASSGAIMGAGVGSTIPVLGTLGGAVFGVHAGMIAGIHRCYE